MPNRAVILAIAAVIALPLLFAALGTSRKAGLTIGVALVVLGLVVGVLGTRGAGDGDDSDRARRRP